MRRFVEGTDRGQNMLFPECLEDWIGEEVWRRGGVIGSWLLDLTTIALARDPKLTAYSGVVDDSGEARWTVMAAIEEAVPAEDLSAALYARFHSRDRGDFADKLLSAMRHEFGGHVEVKAAAA
jgi:6-phosphogluconate dehydrogenase